MPTTHNVPAPTERFRPRDCDRRSYPIGTMFVPAGKGTDRGFQYACDWREHTWEDQVVTLWCDDQMVHWRLVTTVVDEYFGTPRKVEPHPGTWGHSTYTYIFFAQVAHGERPEVTLLPDYAAGYETRTIEATKYSEARDVDFGHLLWNGTHALQVENVWNRNRDGKRPGSGLGYWDEMHAYDVLVRGEKVGELEVDKRRGFNGDTRGPAMHDALDQYRDLLFAS